MKIVLLLLLLYIFNYTVSLVVRKTEIYHPRTSDVINNSKQQYSSTGGDIRYTILGNNNYKSDEGVPILGNLIKSLRIPGFNVHHIVFNRDNTGKYDNTKSAKSQLILENNNAKPNNEIEKMNNTEIIDHKEIQKGPDTENVVDQNFIKTDCDEKNFLNEKCDEETSTNINEVITDTDLSNENSTVTSESDDENYGGISDRSDIPPAVLASLVG